MQPSEAELAERRAEMVREQLAKRDITDPRVLDAMGRVPRHRFVPEALVARAYDDGPLPIGAGQTISQPYVVALMTQLAVSTGTRRALDVGTGSGYQAAVLAELVEQVYGIERVSELARAARSRLLEQGCRNVMDVRHGDGSAGWPEHAPYDAIIVACAAATVPPALVDQLAPGGVLVIPIGARFGLQSLLRLEKRADGSTQRSSIMGVAFVPMLDDADADAPD